MYKIYSSKEYIADDKKAYVEECIKNSDFVVIGGGNMVFDIFSYSLSAARLNYFVELVKKYNKKLLILSIGIGPFCNKKQLRNCIEVLEKSDFLTFRDAKSVELYKQNKLSNKFDNLDLLSSDPAFNLKLTTDNKEKKYILLNVINPNLIYDNEEKVQTVTDMYLKLIEKVSKKHKLIVFSTEQMDVEYINLLKSERDFEFVQINSFDSLIDLYSSCLCLIGTRMHSLIIALTQNIPVYGLIWQDKVRALFEMMDLIELTQVLDGIDVDILMSKIDEICLNIDDFKADMQNQLVCIKDRLALNDLYINYIKEEIVLK